MLKRKQKKSNLWIYVVSIILVLLIGGGCFWCFYYTKTPVYSIHLIQKAVQEQNVTEFKKHVDTEAILSRLYDDYSKIAIQEFDKCIGNDPYKVSIESGFIMGINAVKETSVTAIIGMKNNIKSMKCIKQNSNIANINITITGITGDKNIIIKMRRLPDKTWQAVEIVNGSDLLYESGIVGFIQTYLKALGFAK